jgi:tetratricopeptide (TPR) repeat protein
MAMSYNNSYLFAEADRCLRKALELSDRVSGKERLLLEADYYSRSEGTAAKAVEAYEKFLGIYPDDSFAETKLAYLYLGYEIWDKAVEHSQAAIRNQEKTYYAHSYLASAYEALGRPERAREAAESGIRDIGDNDSFRRDLSDYYLYQGKFKEALEEIDKAIGLSPESAAGRMYRGNLFLYQGDLGRAAENYESLLKLRDPSVRLYYLWWMAQLDVLQGKFKDARAKAGQAVGILEGLKEKEMASVFRIFAGYCLSRAGRHSEAIGEFGRAFDEATETGNRPFARRALEGKALACCAMNSLEDAGRVAAELESLVEKAMNPQEGRRVALVRGVIELQKGNWVAAIDHLKKAVSRLPHEYDPTSDEQALYLEPLALAYFRSVDMDDARAEYEKIMALTTGRACYGDIYARSFYMLGKIAEQQGDKARASQNYHKFLDLWKDADPGLPEVADAKNRLAAVK